MARKLDPGAILSEPADFSLVLGGPLYQLWRRLHVAGPALDLLVRRLVGITALAWLPLLVLTAYAGTAFGHAVPVPFLYDLATHARFLVAIPLLLLAEVVAHQRIRPAVRHFVDAGLVPAAVMPGFRAAIDGAMRLRNSVAVEVGLLVVVFGVGGIVWKELSLATSTWYATAGPTTSRLTPAGQWYAHVSIPIFQFLLLRWYYRLVVWFVLLWRVSRLDLRLTPTHPDRAGGLGFLANAVAAFGPVIVAAATVLSAQIAERILFQGATLEAFKYEIVAFVVLQSLLVLGPLCVFSSVLRALKRRGRREYGALAARYTREFEDKWIEGAVPPAEPLVGSADIQSLADLANSYQVVREIRSVPFGRDTVVQLAVFSLIPFAPLVLTVVPAEEIIKKLLGMLL